MSWTSKTWRAPVAAGAGLALIALPGEAWASASGAVLAAASMDKILAEVLTHLIAFIIFVWILHRYAWKPLLAIIDERREKIAADFDKAESLQKEAEGARDQYEERLREIEAAARKRIQEAVDDGRRVAAEIQSKAREDAEKLLERARANAEIELDNARKQLRQDVVDLTISATEAVLREQVDQAAHRRQIDRFIEDVGALKPSQSA